MTFITQDALSSDAVFITRVRQASVTAATQILAEAANVVGHSRRTLFALDVIRSPEQWGRVIAQGVASNPVIVSASLDSDIQFTVNSLWNAYSGVIN